jgi:hypothetical protein
MSQVTVPPIPTTYPTLYRVNTTTQAIRQTPSATGTILLTVVQGTLVERVDNTSTVADGYKWYKINVGGLTNVYCVADAATPSTSPNLILDTIEQEIRKNTSFIRRKTMEVVETTKFQYQVVVSIFICIFVSQYWFSIL